MKAKEERHEIFECECSHCKQEAKNLEIKEKSNFFREHSKDFF